MIGTQPPKVFFIQSDIKTLFIRNKKCLLQKGETSCGGQIVDADFLSMPVPGYNYEASNIHTYTQVAY